VRGLDLGIGNIFLESQISTRWHSATEYRFDSPGSSANRQLISLMHALSARLDAAASGRRFTGQYL
jgi:hypothetical protein